MGLASCSLGLEAPDKNLTARGQVPGLEGGAEVAVVRLGDCSGHSNPRDLELLFDGLGSIEGTFTAASS